MHLLKIYIPINVHRHYHRTIDNCLAKDDYLLGIEFESFFLLSSFIYVALRIYLSNRKNIFTIYMKMKVIGILNHCFKERSLYLGFNTCTNSINSPVSGVVVVQMNLPESKTRLPLLGSIKKAMVNGHPYAPIPHMRRVCSYKHCLVMLSKVTSGGNQNCINKIINHFYIYIIKNRIQPSKLISFQSLLVIQSHSI